MTSAGRHLKVKKWPNLKFFPEKKLPDLCGLKPPMRIASAKARAVKGYSQRATPSQEIHPIARSPGMNNHLDP